MYGWCPVKGKSRKVFPQPGTQQNTLDSTMRQEEIDGNSQIGLHGLWKHKTLPEWRKIF